MPRELKYQLSDSGARAIVIVENSAAGLAEILRETNIEHVILTAVGDLLGFPRRHLVNFVVRHVRRLVPGYELTGATPFLEVLTTGAEQYRRPENLGGSELACLQYTGGTTGRSKGAMLIHGNLVANIRQVNKWFTGRVEPGHEIVITALPLYHVYAMTCNCLCYLDLGGRDVLITDPRDIDAFIAELRKWKFTTITGVNTLYQRLVNHPAISTVDFTALKLASAGGMAVLESTARQWSKTTGTEILEGYGLSETSPVVCANPPDITSFTGSIGLPLPNTEVSLRNDDGLEVPVGVPGELCVKGPQVMAGYWHDEAATKAAMTVDGFLKTGDIATVDERGFFYVVDRKKDMILVSAFNVFPNEIENVITMHPDIAEAACVGVPDQQTTEAVKAVVVLRPGASVTAGEIREFCRENLAPYKIPKYFEFRQELPKSQVGKILRRELRESESS
jgi:long-chain acyl-CoA synthetase